MTDLISIGEMTELISLFASRFNVCVEICQPDGTCILKSGSAHANYCDIVHCTGAHTICSQTTLAYLEEFTAKGKDVITRRCATTQLDCVIAPVVVQNYHLFNVVAKGLTTRPNPAAQVSSRRVRAAGADIEEVRASINEGCVTRTKREVTLLINGLRLLCASVEMTVLSRLDHDEHRKTLEAKRADFEAAIGEIRELYTNLSPPPRPRLPSTCPGPGPRQDLGGTLGALQDRLQRSPLQRLEDRVASILSSPHVPDVAKCELRTALSDLGSTRIPNAPGADGLRAWLSESVMDAPSPPASSHVTRCNSLQDIATTSPDTPVTPITTAALQLLTGTARDAAQAFLLIEGPGVDIPALQRATGAAMVIIGAAALDAVGATVELGVDPDVAVRWLTHVADLHDASNPFGQAPYDNSRLAADHCHLMRHFLKDPGLDGRLTPLQAMSCVFAVLIGRISHPGVTNTFLLRTEHDLAIMYNDRSPLEQHSLAVAFRETSEPARDILATLRGRNDFAEFRGAVIDMVLASDKIEVIDRIRDLVAHPVVRGEGVSRPALTALFIASQMSIFVRSLPIYQTYHTAHSEEVAGQRQWEQRLDLPTDDMATHMAGISTLIATPIFGYIYQPGFLEDGADVLDAVAITVEHAVAAEGWDGPGMEFGHE